MTGERDASAPVLRVRGMTKRFAGVTALDAVDLDVLPGEVHALVGENGAGKSTLVKLLTGVYRPSAGEMYLDGRPIAFPTPAAAQIAGVVAVHQEIHLLPHRTVAENLFIGREPRRLGLIDGRRMHADTMALLSGLRVDLDPSAIAGELRTAQQQLVSIARGVSMGARVLVLDEPTSALAGHEVALLFDLLGALTAKGTAVMYISHRLDELYAICRRVTVLRDGRLVATTPLAGLDRLDLICLMLGKSRAALEKDARKAGGPSPAASAEPMLRVRQLSRGQRLVDVSAEVRAGEVVGLAGLLGSGRTETARAIAGIDPATSGTMTLNGAPFTPRSPGDAIAAGVAFLPEDRKAEGIIADLSVRENLTMAVLPSLTRFGFVDRARQDRLVAEYARRLGIKMTSGDQRIGELSGGNQQKVLLARWLCTRPDLLILDEPTKGIDVGARGAIQALVHELAVAGLGVLLISSELEELTAACSRVVVLRDGRSVAEIAGEALSDDAIVQAMAAVPVPTDS